MFKKQIKIGDIINFKNTPKHTDMVEKIIEKITKSKYHHTAIVIGRLGNYTLLLEAQGLQPVNIDILEAKTDEYDIFRLKNNSDYFSKHYSEFLAVSLSYLNKQYDYTGVLHKIPWLGKLFKDSKKRVYCSEMVAEIYKHFGYFINGETPADIAKNDILKMIK